MLPGLPKTWLIVPCYNEAARLPGEAFERFARRWPALRLCFVNDGSRDATAECLQALVERIGPQATVLSLSQNRGKAEAVRQGVLHALDREETQFVGFWDADLATPLEELTRLLAVRHEHPEAQVFTGCRLQRMGARIERRATRHFLGRVFATTASLVLQLRCYDTQCGAKLFRAELARQVFALPFLTKWCFDVELLARIVALYGTEETACRVVEVPLLAWRDVGGSKLRWRHWVRAALDLGRIYLRYRRAAPTVTTPHAPRADVPVRKAA